MRHTKTNEKGILQFGVSTDTKFAKMKMPTESKQTSLIQNVVLQQQFETFQAKKREKELKKLKERNANQNTGAQQEEEDSSSDDDAIVK